MKNKVTVTVQSFEGIIEKKLTLNEIFKDYNVFYIIKKGDDPAIGTISVVNEDYIISWNDIASKTNLSKHVFYTNGLIKDKILSTRLYFVLKDRNLGIHGIITRLSVLKIKDSIESENAISKLLKQVEVLEKLETV